MCEKIIGCWLFTLLLLVSPLRATQGGETLKALEKDIQTLIGATKESIVTVTSHFSEEVSVEQESGVLSFFKSEPRKREFSYVNVGSGFIFDEAGYVLTRSSIVLGAEKNVVTLGNGQELEAEFVGQDAETGLAVLKLNAENLQPARMGDSDEIVVGGLNFMVGNSLGVYPSIVFGSVNGICGDGLIQLSMSLAPGNNGSPIINMDGEVIALVAGQLNHVGTIYGSLSTPTLAYPINWVKRIAKDIVKYGYVRKAWLGVVGYPNGVKPAISHVKDESPAQKAGLEEGDIILRFSNKKVKSLAGLARLVEYSSPGETIPLEYLRDGQKKLTNVTLSAKSHPDTTSANTAKISSYQAVDEVTIKAYGSSNAANLMLQQNQMLEKRINLLEDEVNRLKKLVESY